MENYYNFSHGSINLSYSLKDRTQLIDLALGVVALGVIETAISYLCPVSLSDMSAILVMVVMVFQSV